MQAGYDILSQSSLNEQSLTVFVRVEEYDTQDEVPGGFTATGAFDMESVVLGLHYQPINQIVVKTDYAWVEDANGIETNAFNLGLGYIF